MKVLLYDDKITIVYNTSLNPAEEIYNRTNDNDDNNGNSDNGTTIYKKEIEISDADNKKLPFEFKRQSFGGASAPKFEPFTKNKAINPEKGGFETKNEQNGRSKAKNKKFALALQKFSNHIKFIDYIPTHEIITYRRLFAYGFYVE